MLRPRSGPLTEQRGDRGLGQRDGFGDGGELGLFACAAGIGLADRALVLQTLRGAIGESSAVASGPRWRARSRRFGIKLNEVGIGGGDRGREREPGLGEIGPRGFRIGGRGGDGGAVLTPEIELVGEVESGAARVVPALRDERRRHAVVVALLYAGDGRVGGDLRLADAPTCWAIASA